MKKVVIFILAVSILLSMNGCIKNEVEVFEENKTHFSLVADFATTYYERNHSDKEHLTLAFSNGNIIDTETVLNISDKISEATEKIEDAQFEFLWVTSDYVIFWQDETKYYGLLWAEYPKTIIKSIKEDWYDDMEYQKIENNWYEIGVLNAI